MIEAESVPAPRLTLVSARRLALLFPALADPTATSPLSRLERALIRVRCQTRLVWVRLIFRFGAMGLLAPRLAHARLRLRLAWLRLRHRRTLRPVDRVVKARVGEVGA
jgi:hypothetical protein